VRATIFFYSQSPRDGSVISLFPESLAHSQIMQPDIGKWNVAEMAYVGSMSGVNPAFVRRRDAPAKTVADMKRASLNVGCSGKTTQSYQGAAIMKNLAGLQFKIVLSVAGDTPRVTRVYARESRADEVNSCLTPHRVGISRPPRASRSLWEE
jgi:hypothetical protein